MITLPRLKQDQIAITSANQTTETKRGRGKKYQVSMRNPNARTAKDTMLSVRNRLIQTKQ